MGGERTDYQNKTELINFKDNFIAELSKRGWRGYGLQSGKRRTMWCRDGRTVWLVAPRYHWDTKKDRFRLTLWSEGKGEYIWEPVAVAKDWAPFVFRDYCGDVIRPYKNFDEWIQAIREFIQ